MLRSHHLCCVAVHIEKICGVRSFGDPVRCVWGYGGDANYSMGSSPWIQMLCCVWHWGPLHWWIAGITVTYVAGWCPLTGLGRVCSGVLSPCGGPRVGRFPMCGFTSV